jgi:hypothetical protein
MRDATSLTFFRIGSMREAIERQRWASRDALPRQVDYCKIDSYE